MRRATLQDVPALARMLARAFFDDPVAIWSCRPDGLRPKLLERFQATRLRQLLAHQEVWTTPELSSAALWAPPERWKTTPREDIAIARSMASAPAWIGVSWRRPRRTHRSSKRCVRRPMRRTGWESSEFPRSRSIVSCSGAMTGSATPAPI
jgi:hypothetical protein